jgi:hypothetical protein
MRGPANLGFEFELSTNPPDVGSALDAFLGDAPPGDQKLYRYLCTATAQGEERWVAALLERGAPVRRPKGTLVSGRHAIVYLGSNASEALIWRLCERDPYSRGRTIGYVVLINVCQIQKACARAKRAAVALYVAVRKRCGSSVPRDLAMWMARAVWDKRHSF